MTLGPPHRHARPVRVVLSTPALLSFASAWRAAAPAIAQLGIAAFFLPATTGLALGPAAVWFVLAASVLSALVRAADVESWALLVAGGAVGRAQEAFGPRAASVAAAALLAERLLLAALAALVVGQYAAGVPVGAVLGESLTAHVTPEGFSTALAVIVIGLLWMHARVGGDLPRDPIARGIWTGVAFVLIVTIWAVLTLPRGTALPASALIALPHPPPITPWPALDAALFYLFGLALVLPALGGGDPLGRAAPDLPTPRVQALRRLSGFAVVFSLLATTGATLAFALLVPVSEQHLWANAPLAGLARHAAGPPWCRELLAVLVVAAAVLMLVPVVRTALTDAEQSLQRLSLEGMLPDRFAHLHRRFGTPTSAIEAAVAASVLVVLASGGRVTWIARAYAIAIAATLLLKIAALVRLRRTQSGAAAYRAPFNVRVRGQELALGLLIPAGVVAASAAAAALIRDVPSVAAAGLLGALAALFLLMRRDVEPGAAIDDPESFDLLPASDISLDEVQVRPGNVLVPVRNPHALGHVSAALRTAGNRDVVVMTVRLRGHDVSDEAAATATPTVQERRLLSEVVALAERHGRPVRLLIVPADNVFQAVAATIVRLRSSDVYVGESATLSAEDQARLLGDAWERTAKVDDLDVRLVIHHQSTRVDAYHLGPHPPSLTAGDLDLIHRVWLDAVKAIGPHVHHHDVVRAALTQMEQQLSGPQRDEALASIREAARPADELAGALRARDYARLRDMMRNRHAADAAALLTELSVEDQVVVFRVLPREDASAVFEYLSHDAKDALLKGMAQEDVAALLNDMAPDDRTMFLEELPAAATRQLLSLLTPGERSVALTLLGYPERSVGRLMTPQYVAVRENWTVREVLDYVREHGKDSETLNVIYVVDAQGLLIDDVRIREFLLAPLEKRVADLMDRRFAALKATDDQDAAVGIFRQYDRTALPVTDTAGMLIGIVTIDDVLDVAEATATREIQRIGGSEALDEPYMRIAFAKMIQKRAGWLTALFLGEMLTATAMGAFEGEISRAVVLALFVPLIISSGGNSGSQASTLVIRALALGEVGLQDWWRVMRREVLAGLALGAILGSIGFLRITLWSAFSSIYGPHWLLVAFTVSLSLIGVVLWGTLMGSLLPFLLRRLGFDPAASSAPFVATLVDVTGLVIYFTVATVILHGTLL